VSVPVLLEVGQVSEQVTVTAESPLLDTTAVSSGQNFDSRMVEGLPMFSNMPIMLTRFAAGVNPSTSQSLVSQGFADGTTQAAGGAIGGVGSNNYSIDGATNSGSARRIAASPNSDMVQEMRVESSNFDASVGHGTGLQISMMTRSGANQYRGTANYQYWSNRFNELNPSQKLTFTPAGKMATSPTCSSCRIRRSTKSTIRSPYAPTPRTPRGSSGTRFRTTSSRRAGL
jgi:hypothetical protein